MVSINDFKTLSIELDRVNSYIPPIIINEADNNGRHLKFTPTYEGQPVTGITSARMYYDPRPRDASSIGDYVDGTKDGDGWVFVIPPNTFTAGVQGIASVSFTDADGETYTRSMPIDVESGGTKIDGQGTRIDRLIATLEQMVNDFTLSADAETGPAGSQASVKVTKDGASYDLAFTIPRGPQGPKGEPGDAFDAHFNDTIVGNGSSGNPYRVADGTMITITVVPENTDLNTVTEAGVYELVNTGYQNLPDNMTVVRGFLIVYKNTSIRLSQMAIINAGDDFISIDNVYLRSFDGTTFTAWKKLANAADIPASPIFDASTIIGNGTSGNPYKVKNNTLINPSQMPNDLNTITEVGAYVFPPSVVQNAPYQAQRGFLIYSNDKPRSSVELQVAFLSFDGTTFVSEIWMRVKENSDSVWNTWIKVAPTDPNVALDGTTILCNGTSSNKLKLADGTALTPKAVTGSGQDLNNYIKSGIYYIDITSCANTPISGQAGRLIVIKGGNNVSQLFHNTQQNRFFTRAKTNVWSPWVELTSSGAETWPKFSELRSNLQLVAFSETRGLLIFQGGIVQTNSNGIGNISLVSPSYTITPRNTPSWYGPVIVNQNTVEKARFVTSKGNIQITAKASSSIQIAPFTLMVNLS